MSTADLLSQLHLSPLCQALSISVLAPSLTLPPYRGTSSVTKASKATAYLPASMVRSDGGDGSTEERPTVSAATVAEVTASEGDDERSSVLSLNATSSMCSTSVASSSMCGQRGVVGGGGKKARRARRLTGKKKDAVLNVDRRQEETPQPKEVEEITDLFEVEEALRSSGREDVDNVVKEAVSDVDNVVKTQQVKTRRGEMKKTRREKDSSCTAEGGSTVDMEELVQRLHQAKCGKRRALLDKLGIVLWNYPEILMEWMDQSKSSDLVLVLVTSLYGVGGSKVSIPEAILAADIAAGIILIQPPHSISEATFQTVATRLRSIGSSRCAYELRNAAIRLLAVLAFMGSEVDCEHKETVDWLKERAQNYDFAEATRDAKNDVSSRDAQAMLWGWMLLASQWRKSQLADLSVLSDARGLWQFCERALERTDLDIRHSAGLCVAMIFEAIWDTKTPEEASLQKSGEVCSGAVKKVECIASTNSERCRAYSKDERRIQLQAFRCFHSTISEGMLPSQSINHSGGSAGKVDLVGHISLFRYSILKHHLKGSTRYFLEHQPHLRDTIHTSSSSDARRPGSLQPNCSEMFDAPLSSQQPLDKSFGCASRAATDKRVTLRRSWMRDRKEELREVW
eukprot:GHVS01039718.1.p1 GENE.GHVS01039718.1~~GHVS01039718.1.p1  ORF type:complete len:626 (-),score=92.72 GHVS01039718.1:779-2656(-)